MSTIATRPRQVKPVQARTTPRVLATQEGVVWFPTPVPFGTYHPTEAEQAEASVILNARMTDTSFRMGGRRGEPVRVLKTTADPLRAYSVPNNTSDLDNWPGGRC